MVCVGTQCVPSVATRVVAKIYRPFFILSFLPSFPLDILPTLRACDMICASTSALLPLLLPLPRVSPPRLRAAGTPLESLEPRASYFSGPAEEEIFLAQLQRRVEELERLLPGLDVPALLEREPDLVDNPHVLTRVVALQEALPRAHVATLVRRAPGLLLVKDVRANLAALQALLPGADLPKLLQAAPTLLLRTPAGIGAKIDALQAALGAREAAVRVVAAQPTVLHLSDATLRRKLEGLATLFGLPGDAVAGYYPHGDAATPRRPGEANALGRLLREYLP